MGVTFDGPNKRIIATNGTVSLSVVDIYSRWKEWMLASDNSKYAQALRVVGGDPTIGANSIAPYFFLLNGWRLRPQEADHTLAIDGTLLVDGGGNPVVPTLGSYKVVVLSTIPVRAEAVATGGGSVDLTAVVNRLDAMAAVLDYIRLHGTGGSGGGVGGVPHI